MRAVDHVNLTVRQGETMGLVGEFGCGKTTTGRPIMRGYQPTSGEIRFHDPGLGWVDIPDPGEAGSCGRCGATCR